MAKALNKKRSSGSHATGDNTSERPSMFALQLETAVQAATEEAVNRHLAAGRTVYSSIHGQLQEVSTPGL